MSFSQYAADHIHYLSTPPKALEMFGSEYLPTEPGDPPKPSNPKLLTDCITFVGRVVSEAFRKSGDYESAQDVMTLLKDGTLLANYLVENHDWIAVYCNPDVSHPIDGDPEHPSTYKSWKKYGTYYGVKTEYACVNYDPTKQDNDLWTEQGWKKPEIQAETEKFEALSQIDFGYGLSWGAYHTWLFTNGRVREVHWSERGIDLYDDRALKVFEGSRRWLSHLIVFPPDALSDGVRAILAD